MRAWGQYGCNARAAVQTWDECALAKPITYHYINHLK